MGTPSSLQSPTTVVNQGLGTQWANPASAAAMGEGSSTPLGTLSYSITSNVATFVTQQQISPLVAGQSVVLSTFEVGAYFNGQTVVVRSAGLTLTSFTAIFVHADVGSTVDVGIATPTTAFASAAAFNYYTPSAGQFVAYTTPPGPDPAAQSKSGNFFGDRYSLVTTLRALYGVQGNNFDINGFTATSNGCPIPQLPFGATVVGIYPCATGVFHGTSQSLVSFYASWGGGSPGTYTFALNGTFERRPTSLGTDLNVLPTLTFNNTSEANNGTGPYWDSIVDFRAAVVYTLPTGASIPPLRLQTLAASNFSFSLSPHTVASGVEVSFATGTNPISVTNYSITGDVATFTTQTPVTVGQVLTLSDFATGTYFNNQSLTVLPGASATSFTANFTHADVSSTPDTGTAAPIAATLTAQLTLNGRPIGQPKVVNTSSWTSTYTLGGDGDLWGTVEGDLTDETVNGSTGLGVNISGTLPAGSQINLNDIQLQVFTIFKLTLPSFALIAAYSTSGDTSTTPSASLVAIPSSATAGTPITLLWNTGNIVQIEITANNGTDPPIDTGLVDTQGSGTFDIPAGLSVTTTFTLNAYDTIGHLAITTTTPVTIT